MYNIVKLNKRKDKQKMKNKKILKAAALLTASVCIISVGISGNIYVSAENINFRTSSNYFRNRLSGDEQKFYDNLLTVCNKINNNFKKEYETTQGAEFNSSTISNDQAKEIALLFVRDHPEFFWISASFELASSGNTSSLVIRILPDYRKGEARKNASEAINSAAANYIKGALKYSDPYSRALYLHDELAKNISYDYKSSLDESPENQTIASAFINKKTVCAGFSRAYTYLCNAVGIDAVSVPATGHEWTMVKVGSEWYCTDVTYDATENISHKYFLCDYSSFQKGTPKGEHLIDEQDVPSYVSLFPSCQATDKGKNALNWGDLNGDSVIDQQDIEMVKNPATLSEQQKAAADLDCNGTIDESDAQVLSDYISKKISRLPALEYPVLEDDNFNFTDTGILGDVNGDNAVNSKDAVYVLVDYAKTLTGNQSSLNKKSADINGDGIINSIDAVKILQYYAKTLTDPSLKSMEDFLNGK